jgi:predicted permease
MDGLFQDLRYGVRMLLRSPGFTAVAVLALALGIGANAAIFSLINTVLLRPLPAVPDPDRLVATIVTSGAGSYNNLSYPDYLDYRERNDVFSGMLGHSLISVALGHGGQNDLLWGEIVTGDYFSVLGATPTLGRGFLPEEYRGEGSHPVVVIGHSLWQRRFASDPRIVGGTLTLNGRDFTVVGVAPAGFTGTEFALGMDLWVPIMMHDTVMPGSDDLITNRERRWMKTIARLNPGVTIPQASAAMAIASERLAREHPDTNRGVSMSVVAERQGQFPSEAWGGISVGAFVALAVVGLVLLVACANVANLLLARAAARRREIGIRLALGAGRFRLVRQFLTEGLFLALLGGCGAVLLTLWVSDLLLSFHPPIPFNLALDYTPDGRVLLFTGAVSVLTAVIFGLAPALHASNPELVPLLKGEGGRAGAKRGRPSLRSLLVVGQVGLSLVVLVSAGLFLKSLKNAATIDPGFRTKDILVTSFDLGLLGYTEEKGRAFQSELKRRVEALPGVASAALLDDLPLDYNWNTTGPILADGQPAPADGRGIYGLVGVVTPGLFETLGIPLVRGRDFTEHDDANAAAVTILNETLAGRLWPGEDPIGKRVRFGGVDAPTREVIGVARDARYKTLGEGPQPYLYRPVAQLYGSDLSLLVRSQGDPALLSDAVRREVRALDSRLPLSRLATMDEHMGFALWWTRMGAALASVFGALALVLAAVGLYGVLAYSVSQRTREIGIRMALGARPGDVVRLVVGDGLRLGLAGVGVGLLAGVLLGRVMSSLLYGVGSADPATFAGLALLLCATALLASYVPARRAARVDPMVALRQD